MREDTETKFRRILGDLLFDKMAKLHPDLHLLISFLNEFINPEEPRQVMTLVLEMDAIGMDFSKLKPYGDLVRPGSDAVSIGYFVRGFPQISHKIIKVLLHVRDLYLEYNIKTEHFDRQGSMTGPSSGRIMAPTPPWWQTIHRIGPDRLGTNRYRPHGIKIRRPRLHKPIKANLPKEEK